MPEEQTQAALKNPLYSDIVRGTGDLTPMGADVAQVVWSGCSALAHGDAFGTLSILDGRSWPKGGVATIRVTGSISSLFWCTVTGSQNQSTQFGDLSCGYEGGGESQMSLSSRAGE
jgi:hypothetical protein